MKLIPVFTWSDDLGIDDPDDDPESLTLNRAKVPAQAILDAVRALGHNTNVELPFGGEGGWHFTVDVSERTYGIFLLWTGIGSNDDDYFAIQPTLKRGVLAALFGKAVVDERMRPVVEVLENALATISEVADVHWLTDDEFSKCYCDGQPWPASDN